MRSTDLRHRITIEGQTQTQDANTLEWVTVWGTFLANEPAQVVPLSGREYIRAAANQAGVDTRMAIRHRDGLTADMRVVFDGQNYNVLAVLPDPTNARWLTLMCQRGINDGG